MAKSEGAVCHLSVCLLVCSSTLEQNIPSLFQVCLNWSWFAEMLQKTVCQINIEESQLEPEIPTCDWFTQHWGRQSSLPHLCFTSELDQQLSGSTPGHQFYDAKLLWRWRRKKVTTCWLIDCQEKCGFWSCGAPVPGPWKICSYAGEPPSCPSFCVFLVAASIVKAVSLRFCTPKSPQNSKEKI